MARYKQFCLYKLVPSKTNPGKTDKFPCSLNGNVIDAHNPVHWLDSVTALSTANVYGPQYGVAFVFTENDPFFFLDIDSCLQDNSTWSDIAVELMNRLSGAAVEVSHSKKGLHVFGTYSGPAPSHGCTNKALGLELYTEKRFVALTGLNAVGSASVECAGLEPIIAQYFPEKIAPESQEWTTEPVSEWTGTTDDSELINQALKSKSIGSKLAGRITFEELWGADEDALAKTYPDPVRAYDSSAADAALAQHLAFWTGKNCERIRTLMKQSGLVREKWEDREDYLVRTITRAVGLQKDVYSVGGSQEVPGAPKLKGSPKQIARANDIRSQKISLAPDLITELCPSHGPLLEAKFWIENQGRTPAEIADIVRPVETVSDPLGKTDEPELLSGYQFLGIEQQLEHFKGCVYVQEAHKVLTPSGALLGKDQFNVTYGGYSFQTDADGNGKTTKKAWDAFTESQAIRYRKAESTCFRPQLPPGAFVEQDGRIHVNTYVPVETPRKQGDPAPFLNHLAKVLPDERDQAILLSYMAAGVQYKGVKFQWAPLLQGVEGNGKTLFTRCEAAAIGDRYVHLPPAHEISEKFNSWLFNTLFIGVEDIYVPDQKREVIEVLKPMITGEKLACRAMQTDQIMRDVCCNFIFNSNHKDAVKKTLNDRRFAVFFTAQQEVGDLVRDGMAGNYFPLLYDWLRAEGYAIVTDYLYQYQIPNELNPATHLMRAPETSSTSEAIRASLGSVEQEILEAVDENRPGFAGGWISSMALERLLQGLRMGRSIPPNKRRELLKSLGYDWHPALKEGRVNNVIALDGGKPRLFIRKGHISANLQSPAEVIKSYEGAQGSGTGVPGSIASKLSK
jgi:hypothetical protein